MGVWIELLGYLTLKRLPGNLCMEIGLKYCMLERKLETKVAFISFSCCKGTKAYCQHKCQACSQGKQNGSLGFRQ